MPKKPRKPYPSYPLTPHASGRFVKKVKGRFWYSTSSNPDEALDQWLAEKDAWLAGHNPRGRITLKELIDNFIESKAKRYESGELAKCTLDDYVVVGKYIVDHFGRETDPERLGPSDFADFRAAIAKRYSLARLSKVVTNTRSMMDWGFQSELLEKMPRFGPDFKVPSKAQKRKAKAKNGKMMLESSEIRLLLEKADTRWTAMVLLGINGGMKNSDIAELKLSDVGGEFLDYPRQKTGVERRIPLWPETRAAIEKYIAKRPKCDSELLFVSRNGGPMIAPSKAGRSDLIGQGFHTLLKQTKVYRPRMGFGWLRHVFQTVADKAKDPVATRAIMGHAGNSISDEYREELPDDERLQAVTDCVHAWLFPVISSEEE